MLTLVRKPTLNGAEGLAHEIGGIQRQDSTQAGLCVESRTLLLGLVGPSVMICQGHCGLIVSVMDCRSQTSTEFQCAVKHPGLGYTVE